MPSRGMERSRKHTVFLFCAVLVGAVLLLSGIYALGRWVENREYREERQQMTEGFGQMPTVTYEGKTYARRPEVTTLLIMGVDQDGDEEPTGYRDGGQADFLLLLAIDHKSGTVSQLQIDRDSITDVPVVGVLGNDAGTRRMQISLSHAYGASEADRSRHTVQALANLLDGETVDIYLSVHLEAIGALNRLLGGLTVTIPADYSDLDPAMTEGAVLTLTDEQAVILIRARRTIGDGTNAARTIRQREFMQAALKAVKERFKADAGFAETLLEALDEVNGFTNVQRSRLVSEITQALSYDILPAETLAGEYTHGADGFTEFYADEDAIVAWLLKTLYEPK